MKRYASHFLFLPGHGYLKQYVVEKKVMITQYYEAT